MKLKIGEIYRYPKEISEDKEKIDGLPNYFYYTKVEKFDSTFAFQKGIHSVKKIHTLDGKSRCPVIIISSSPYKAGVNIHHGRIIMLFVQSAKRNYIFKTKMVKKKITGTINMMKRA